MNWRTAHRRRQRPPWHPVLRFRPDGTAYFRVPRLAERLQALSDAERMELFYGGERLGAPYSPRPPKEIQ